MPHTRINCFHMADVNWLPLSDVIDSGTPNVETKPCAKASITDWVVMSRMGIARGQRESLSTAVKRCLKPLDSGNVTRSTFQCWKRFGGTVNSPIGGMT